MVTTFPASRLHPSTLTLHRVHMPALRLARDPSLLCPSAVHRYLHSTVHLPAPVPAAAQVELKATKVVHVGGTDPAEYPLAKKKQVR